MKENSLRAVWSKGRAATNVWATIPSAYATEIIAHQQWDSLTIDTQHGLVDYSAMVAMLTAISTTPTTPLVRIGWNEPAEVMRAADAGAMGVICPTINNRDECQRFVGALRYPPLGYRSMGPNRARFLGSDYATKSNATVLASSRSRRQKGLQMSMPLQACPDSTCSILDPQTLASHWDGRAAWIKPTRWSSAPSTTSWQPQRKRQSVPGFFACRPTIPGR